MREVIVTGKTVDEATEKGYLQLGLSRDEVSVEILEMPQRKWFKILPAKVKVSANDQQAAEPAKEAPENIKKEKPAKKPQKSKPAAVESEKLLPEEPEVMINLQEDSRANAAAEYLMSILGAMGAEDAKIVAAKQGDATLLKVEGDSISQKMEVRGDVIQALSYLIDRSVNAGVDKKDKDYIRVRLDVAGYRNRRESELIALANRTGEEVVRTKRSRTLAPMNPYERLIVHTAISKMEGVISESTGTDVERRVIIKSTAPDAVDGDDWRAPRHGGGRQGSRSGNRGRNNYGKGGGRGNRNDRGNRGGNKSGGNTQTPTREYANKPHNPDAAPIVPSRREAIKDGEDMPLYGKIEI